jgi:hypothetical protein
MHRDSKSDLTPMLWQALGRRRLPRKARSGVGEIDEATKAWSQSFSEHFRELSMVSRDFGSRSTRKEHNCRFFAIYLLPSFVRFNGVIRSPCSAPQYHRRVTAPPCRGVRRTPWHCVGTSLQEGVRRTPLHQILTSSQGRGNS